MRNNKLLKLGSLFVSIFVAGLLIVNITRKPTTEKSSPLGRVVLNSLSGTKGIYGVAIKNLKTGEDFYLNEHRVFQTGSLYKLWVMAEAYRQIENGTISENEILTGDVTQLNNEFNIPAEEADLSDGYVSLTAKDAIFQMITISHNYAALLLTEKIKGSNLKQWLRYQNDLPVSTPDETASFLEKLYKGEIVGASSSAKMLNVLKQQKLNDGLPKYLPNVIVAHKTGTLGHFQHDAGIVFSPMGDYIIVVLSESDSTYGAEERIALLSKDVYMYFAKNYAKPGK